MIVDCVSLSSQRIHCLMLSPSVFLCPQVHHILYLFAQLGDRATTEIAVRKVMEKGYGVDFYAGKDSLPGGFHG